MIVRRKMKGYVRQNDPLDVKAYPKLDDRKMDDRKMDDPQVY